MIIQGTLLFIMTATLALADVEDPAQTPKAPHPLFSLPSEDLQEDAPVLVENQHDEESDVYEVSTGDSKRVGKHSKSKHASAKKSERDRVLRIHWDNEKSVEQSLYEKPKRETKRHELSDELFVAPKVDNSNQLILNEIAHIEQDLAQPLEPGVPEQVFHS